MKKPEPPHVWLIETRVFGVKEIPWTPVAWDDPRPSRQSARDRCRVLNDGYQKRRYRVAKYVRAKP